MSRIKILIHLVEYIDYDEAFEYLEQLDQDEIYHSLLTTDNVSLNLLAISINEANSFIGETSEWYLDNLDGSNVKQYVINDFKYYQELYDRDINAITSMNRDYDPYVAIILIDDVYAGHVYFWQTIKPIYNIMGIRSSHQYMFERKNKLNNISITPYLLDSIKETIENGSLMRLVAPFPHMQRLALSLGMIEERLHPEFIEEYDDDEYFGDGPITSGEEACCGNGLHPMMSKSTKLHSVLQIHQIIQL